MNTLIKTIEIIGIFAFALSGIIEARKKGMDLVGVYAVGMVTAFGGGSLRDVILNRHPLFWVEHFWYPIILLALSFIAGFIVRQVMEHAKAMGLVLVLDALGLGLFSASGASLAYQAGIHPFIAALLGVTTGVFGGVLRDIICNEIPYVFQRTELYATCAFAGAWSYLFVTWTMANEFVAVMACITVTFVLRLFAIRYKIRLPI
ncbi:MAG: trimeric intracellular cation channel family protein [Nitrospiraceae bacterium]|nr:trimeric intracellular cation channel family protein [Nitrospiraceae bacterium]